MNTRFNAICLLVTATSALLPVSRQHAVAGEARLATLPTAQRFADIMNAANVIHVAFLCLEDLAAELTNVLKATNSTK